MASPALWAWPEAANGVTQGPDQPAAADLKPVRRQSVTPEETSAQSRPMDPSSWGCSLANVGLTAVKGGPGFAGHRHEGQRRAGLHAQHGPVGLLEFRRAKLDRAEPAVEVVVQARDNQHGQRRRRLRRGRGPGACVRTRRGRCAHAINPAAPRAAPCWGRARGPLPVSDRRPRRRNPAGSPTGQDGATAGGGGSGERRNRRRSAVPPASRPAVRSTRPRLVAS